MPLPRARPRWRLLFRRRQRRIAWCRWWRILARGQTTFFGGPHDGGRTTISRSTAFGMGCNIGYWRQASPATQELIGGYVFSALRARFEWFDGSVAYMTHRRHGVAVTLSVQDTLGDRIHG